MYDDASADDDDDDDILVSECRRYGYGYTVHVWWGTRKRKRLKFNETAERRSLAVNLLWLLEKT